MKKLIYSLTQAIFGWPNVESVSRDVARAADRLTIVSDFHSQRATSLRAEITRWEVEEGQSLEIADNAYELSDDLRGLI